MRRHRHLGSAPATHRKSARIAVKAARFWLKQGRRFLEQRRCRAALNALTEANRMAAVTTADRRGAGKYARLPMRQLESAEDRFARVCLLKE